MQGAAPDTTLVAGAAPDTTPVLAAAGRGNAGMHCDEVCWTSGCGAAGATWALVCSKHVSPVAAHTVEIEPGSVDAGSRASVHTM